MPTVRTIRPSSAAGKMSSSCVGKFEHGAVVRSVLLQSVAVASRNLLVDRAVPRFHSAAAGRDPLVGDDFDLGPPAPAPATSVCTSRPEMFDVVRDSAATECRRRRRPVPALREPTSAAAPARAPARGAECARRSAPPAARRSLPNAPAKPCFEFANSSTAAANGRQHGLHPLRRFGFDLRLHLLLRRLQAVDLGLLANLLGLHAGLGQNLARLFANLRRYASALARHVVEVERRRPCAVAARRSFDDRGHRTIPPFKRGGQAICEAAADRRVDAVEPFQTSLRFPIRRAVRTSFVLRGIDVAQPRRTERVDRALQASGIGRAAARRRRRRRTPDRPRPAPRRPSLRSTVGSSSPQRVIGQVRQVGERERRPRQLRRQPRILRGQARQPLTTHVGRALRPRIRGPHRRRPRGDRRAESDRGSDAPRPLRLREAPRDRFRRAARGDASTSACNSSGKRRHGCGRLVGGQMRDHDGDGLRTFAGEQFAEVFDGRFVQKAKRQRSAVSRRRAERRRRSTTSSVDTPVRRRRRASRPRNSPMTAASSSAIDVGQLDEHATNQRRLRPAAIRSSTASAASASSAATSTAALRSCSCSVMAVHWCFVASSVVSTCDVRSLRRRPIQLRRIFAAASGSSRTMSISSSRSDGPVPSLALQRPLLRLRAASFRSPAGGRFAVRGAILRSEIVVDMIVRHVRRGTAPALTNDLSIIRPNSAEADHRHRAPRLRRANPILGSTIDGPTDSGIATSANAVTVTSDVGSIGPARRRSASESVASTCSRIVLESLRLESAVSAAGVGLLRLPARRPPDCVGAKPCSK